MTDAPISHDFVYVHTDIPAGMTIREWRAQRAADRAAAVRRAARAAWPPSALGRRLTATVRTWMRAVRQAHQPTPAKRRPWVVPGPVRQPWHGAPGEPSSPALRVAVRVLTDQGLTAPRAAPRRGP